MFLPTHSNQTISSGPLRRNVLVHMTIAKASWAGWLLNNRNLFLIELKTGMFKSKVVAHSVSSVTQSCPTLSMDRSMPGLTVHHQLPEFTQTCLHWVSDAIKPSHTLSSFPPAFSLSQHQGLCQWVSSSHQVAKFLELQLQHQFFQWIFRTGFL